MKYTLSVLAVIVAICFTAWQVVQSQDLDSSTESVDESQITVAEYNWDGSAKQISLADLKAAIEKLPPHRQEKYDDRTSKAEYLDELIAEKLKLLAAIEREFDKDEEFLKKAEDYKHQLMVERLTENEVDNKISYTEEDIKQYYQTNKSEYIEEPEVQATCIALLDEDRAQEVLEEIKGGKDIVAAAKELWEVGELEGPGVNEEEPGRTRFFSRDEANEWKELIDTLFEMEIGEMTQEVFETDIRDKTHFMIFSKRDHRPERQKELDEVRNRVERQVEREKKRQRITEWVKAFTTEGKLKTFPERIPEPQPDEESEEETSPAPEEAAEEKSEDM